MKMSVGYKISCGVMRLKCNCEKCGSSEYQVKTMMVLERNSKLKLEFGTYYLKICLQCGYTEMYSAKILEGGKNEKPCPEH